VQVQNFVKAKDDGEHLSIMVSSLRMQLGELNAEKRHLQYENKSLRARLDEIERSDKAKVFHRSSVQDKDAAARESTHGRLSGHGMDGTENFSQPHHTASLTRSENAQHREHMIAGDRNVVADQVFQSSCLLHY